MQVDIEAVDFGLVAFDFRYAKEFTLYNTCVIPMHYSWRVPKDSADPAHKEFTVRTNFGCQIPVNNCRFKTAWPSSAVTTICTSTVQSSHCRGHQ